MGGVLQSAEVLLNKIDLVDDDHLNKVQAEGSKMGTPNWGPPTKK